MTTETKVSCPRCGNTRLDHDRAEEPYQSTICLVCGLWWWTSQTCPSCGRATVAWDIVMPEEGIRQQDCWSCGWGLREIGNPPPFLHEERHDWSDSWHRIKQSDDANEWDGKIT
jgi:hypothetical protein